MPRSMVLWSLDDLIGVLHRLGQVPSEGTVGFTELDHGLQCAFELSCRMPGDIELQVAGLVHDIGHHFGDDAAHAGLGGQAVAAVLGQRSSAVVAAHVTAKRYLITTSPHYAEELSPISALTLDTQGGTLTDDEMKAFRGSAHWTDAVALRRADDAAKVPGRPVPGLDHWLPALRAVAAAAAFGRSRQAELDRGP